MNVFVLFDAYDRSLIGIYETLEAAQLEGEGDFGNTLNWESQGGTWAGKRHSVEVRTVEVYEVRS